MKSNNSNLTYLKAKAKVEKLKGFYTHLTVYLVINTVIMAVKVMNNMNNGETFKEALINFSTIITWIVWGVAILLHAFSVFGILVIFGEDWRALKIEKLMNDELKNN